MRRSELVLAWLALAFGGCTVTQFPADECTNSDQCRAAFGFGYACTDDGLCRPADMHPRCTTTEPTDVFARPEDYSTAIVVGSILDSTDDSDRASENATRLAVTQVNELDGVDGRTFAVVFCDSRMDLTLDELDGDAAAREVARYLAEDLGVPVIVGTSTSGQAAAVYPVTSAAGTVVISHSATSPDLTELDTTGLLWRTAPPDSLQGSAIAGDMRRRMIDNVAVIHELGPYGEALANVFRQEFADGSHTVELFPFEAGSGVERDGHARNVGEDAAVDEVLFISSVVSDVTAFVNFAVAQPGYATKQIFVTDTAASDQFVMDTAAAASDLFDQIRGTRPTLPSGADYTAFEGFYNAAFPSAPAIGGYPYAAFTYDAIWLAFYGSAWAQLAEPAVTGRTIAEGLRHISDQSLPESPVTFIPDTWRETILQFGMRTDVNLTGASGPLDYDPTTEETVTPIDVWRIEGVGPGATIVVDTVVTPGS